MPLKCLSRVMGNYHARFLGGKGAARLLPYPVHKGDEMKAKQAWILLCGVFFFINACSVHTPLPKVSSQEIERYYTQYSDELEGINKNQNDKKIVKWIQASNKEEPCKVFVGSSTDDDRTVNPEYQIFWDGKCKNGLAYGIGREFVRGVLVDMEAIAIYSGKQIEPDYYIHKFNLDNVLIEGELNKGYVVKTTIEETNMNLNIQYQYGYFGPSGRANLTNDPALVSTTSPFHDNSMFVKAYSNYSYQIIDYSNNEFDDRRYDVMLMDKNTQPNGFGFSVSKQDHRNSFEFSHGTLVRKVQLPPSYLDEIGSIFQEVKEAGRKAIAAQKKALMVKKQYKKRICKDSITVRFIDNAEYNEICDESHYYEKLKGKVDEKIVKINLAKAQKRAQQNQAKLIQARQMEALAAQRQASAAETANFNQSMQNINQNSQLQQLNNNLFMMRMGL